MNVFFFLSLSSFPISPSLSRSPSHFTGVSSSFQRTAWTFLPKEKGFIDSELNKIEHNTMLNSQVFISPFFFLVNNKIYIYFRAPSQREP